MKMRTAKKIARTVCVLVMMIWGVMCCFAGNSSALETGIPNLEVWGYIQNETAIHTTTNPGLENIFEDFHVAPALGIHPASPIINGLSRQNTVDHRGSMMKFENTFNLKALYRLVDTYDRRITLFSRFYLLYDSVYNMENDIGYRSGGLPGAMHGSGDPRHWYRDQFNDNTFKQIVKELYVDINTPALDIRIGKQMIVWGEIDGFRLLDLVNPFDLREFILDDYEDSRIAQWSIDAKWRFMPSKPDQFLEFVFIPDFEANQLMREGSQWEVDELKVYNAGVRAFQYVDDFDVFGPDYHFKNNYSKPGQSIKNANMGVRLSGVAQMKRGALAYSFSYFYTWDASWTPFVKGWYMPGVGNVSSHHQIPGTTDQFILAPTTIERKHTRNHVFGSTFNKVVGTWQFRGELAYTLNKYTGVDPLRTGRSGQDMEKKKDTVDYCLGFDKNVFTDVFLSGQIIQSIVLNADSHMVKGLSLQERRSVNTFFTFVIQKLFNNDQMGVSSLIAYGTEGEWWINPKIWWEVTQNIKATLAAQIFEGNHYDTLGQMDDNDNIFIQLKYSF
jgi:hypothetical protein